MRQLEVYEVRTEAGTERGIPRLVVTATRPGRRCWSRRQLSKSIQPSPGGRWYRILLRRGRKRPRL